MSVLARTHADNPLASDIIISKSTTQKYDLITGLNRIQTESMLVGNTSKPPYIEIKGGKITTSDGSNPIAGVTGNYVDKAGDTMTGALNMSNNKITNLGTPILGTDAVNKTYVDAGSANVLLKTGDSMSGTLNMSNNKITNLGTPTLVTDATNKSYVDSSISSNALLKSGGTMLGDINMNNRYIYGITRADQRMSHVPMLTSDYMLNGSSPSTLHFSNINGFSIALPDATTVAVGWEITLIFSVNDATASTLPPNEYIKYSDLSVAYRIIRPSSIRLKALDNSSPLGVWFITYNTSTFLKQFPAISDATEFSVDPGFNNAVITTNTDLVVGVNYYVDTTAGGVTLRLPQVGNTRPGDSITIRDKIGTWDTGFAIVNPRFPDTINGRSSITFKDKYDTATFVSNGTDRWFLSGNVMVGSTGSDTGERGLVPKPNTNDKLSTLLGDATYSNIPFTKHSNYSSPISNLSMEIQNVYSIDTSAGSSSFVLPKASGFILGRRIYAYQAGGSSGSITFNATSPDTLRSASGFVFQGSSYVPTTAKFHILFICATPTRWDFIYNDDGSSLPAPVAYLPLIGGTMGGDIDINSHDIKNVKRLNKNLSRIPALPSNYTISATVESVLYFTDTAGFSVVLPNATTLPEGWSVTMILPVPTGLVGSPPVGYIKYTDSSNLYKMSRPEILNIVLINNSTANGIWIVYTDKISPLVISAAFSTNAEFTIDPGNFTLEITANTTLAPGTNYYVDTTSGAITVTLPDASTIPTGTTISVKDSKGTWDVNNVTVNRSAGNKLNGFTSSMTLSNKSGVVFFMTNGTDSWYSVGSTMVGSSLGLPGASGLVPYPKAGTQDAVLTGGGTYSKIPFTRIDAVKTSNFPAETQIIYPVNTAASAITATLVNATTQLLGSSTYFYDATGTFSANNLTVNTIFPDMIRNISSGTLTNSIVINTNHTHAEFICTAVGRWDYYTKNTAGNLFLPLAGGTMLGNIDMNTAYSIDNLPDPSGPQQPATRHYVDTTKLSIGGGTMSGDINMNNANFIINLPGPTATHHAANKQYVDSVAAGLFVKNPVRVVTITSLPTYVQAGAGVGATLTGAINGALPAIDGITLIVGDRILVNEDGSITDDDNGIYTVTNLGSAGSQWVLTRATDFDTSSEIVYGSLVFATEGTTCSGCGYVLVGTGSITVDTTLLKFVHFSNPSGYLMKSGDTMTGALNMSSNIISNLSAPTLSHHAANKSYVDSTVYYSVITANPAPAVVRTRYLANTSGGAFSVTMPVGVTPGEWVEFADLSRTFGTNALTINSSGGQQFFIAGIATGTSTLPLTESDYHIKLLYIGSAKWMLEIINPPVTELPVYAVTADPAPAIKNSKYMVNTTASSFSFTLPNSSSLSTGTQIEVYDSTGTFSTNNLIIQRSGTDLIYAPGVAGATSLTLNVNNDSRKFVKVGSQRWEVVGASPAASSSFTNVAITANPSPGLISRRYFANTSGGAFTFTVPLGAAIGDQIEIFDAASSFKTNNLTLQSTLPNNLTYPETNSPVSSLVLICNDTHILLTYTATNLWLVEYISPSPTEGVAIPITANPSPAIKNARYMCDTTSSAFVVTLPNTATSYITLGTTVEVFDAKGTFATNNLTVQTSGVDMIYIANAISSNSMVLNTNNDNRKFVYVSANRWEVSGGSSASLTIVNTSVDPSPALVRTEYHVNTTSGPINFTLPTAPTNGSHIRIVDAYNKFSQNNLTVLPGGADRITTGTSLVLSGFGQVLDLFYDSTSSDWKVANHQVPNPVKLHKAVVTKSGISVFANTNTDVSFDTIATNIGNIASVPSATPIIISQAGFYNVTANCSYTSGDPNTSAHMRIISSVAGNISTDNDANIPALFSKSLCASINTTLAVGEIIKVQLFHNSLGATGFSNLSLSVVQIADSVLTNVSQALEYSSVTRASAQLTGISANSPILFDTVLKEVGSSVVFNTSTSTWTLLAGKSYYMHAHINKCNFSTASGAEVIFQWRDITGGADLGIGGSMISPTAANYSAETGVATAYFTPVVNSQVRLMIKGTNNTLAIGDYTSSTNGGMHAVIEVLSDNTRVAPFTGSTASQAGVQGLVPTPAAGEQYAALLGNATWTKIPVTRQTPLGATLSPADIGTRYAVNTLSSSFTLTLPSSSTVPLGSVVEIIDAKQNFSVNNFTVARAGSDQIYQLNKTPATSVVFSKNNSSARFILTESLKWLIETIDVGTTVTQDITSNPSPAVVGTSYHADTSSGAFTITLPTAPPDGSYIQILDSMGTFDVNNLTVTRGGSDTIEGGISVLYSSKYDQIDLYYHAAGSRWISTQHNVPAPVILQRNEVVASSNVNVYNTTPQTALVVTLPTAGTYSVTAICIGELNNNGTTFRLIYADLYDASTTSAIPNSQIRVVSTTYPVGGAMLTNTSTGTIQKIITTTGAKTIALRGYTNDVGPGTTSSLFLAGTTLRYDQLPSTVVSNVVDTTHHSFAVGSTQTFGFGINSPLMFGTLSSEVGISAVYNSGTYTWTLQPNKTYLLLSSVARVDFSTTPGDFTIQWRNITDGIDLGSSSTFGNVSNGSNVGYSGTATAIITPSATKQIQVVVKKNTNVSSIGDPNGGSAGMSGYVVVLNDPSGSTVMAGASGVSNGASGRVPLPAAGQQNAVLRGDAQWSNMPITKFSTITANPVTPEVGVLYICNTTAASFTFSLPNTASFPVGSSVEVIDAKQTFAINNLIIQRSGSDLIYQPGIAGATSMVLTENSSHRRFVISELNKWVMVAAGTGSGAGMTIVPVSANLSPAAVSTSYHADSSSGSFTITLPAAPPNGSQIQILDVKGTFGTNFVNVNRGVITDSIEGYAQITLNTNYLVTDFVYNATNSRWIVRYSDVPSPIRLAYVFVRKSLTQAITTEADVVNFDTPVYDTEGLFNSTTGRFTAPRTGKYSISARLTLNPPPSLSVDVQIGISVNGATFVERQLLTITDPGYQSLTVDSTIDMIAGDYLTIRLYCSNNVSIYPSNIHNRIIIREQPVYSVVNAVLPMEYLFASQNTAQLNVAANNRINFNNVLASGGTSISLSGGIFTLSAGKTYKLYASIRLANSSTGNGVLDFQWYNITSAAFVGVGGVLISANATDSSSTKSEAEVVLTPAVTTQLELRVISVSTVGLNINHTLSSCIVETIADTARVSSFIGATSVANGLSGIVPQPLAGDQTKVLTGDGTWRFPQNRYVKIMPNKYRGYQNHGFAFISSDDLIVTNGYAAANIYMNGFNAGISWFPTNQSLNGAKTGTWAGITQGYYGLAAWTTTGELWSAGYNQFGWLANGTTNSEYILKRRNNGIGPQNVIDVLLTESDGTGITIYALTSTGQVWSCGYNPYGQCVTGNFTSSITSWNQITGFTGSAIKIAASMSEYATIFIVTNQLTNNLWAAGYNGNGPIGNGASANLSALVNINENVTDVESFMIDATGGYANTTILTKQGRIKGTGYNAHGVIGDGTTVTKNVFTNEALGKTDWVRFGGSSDGNGGNRWAIDSSGAFYTWGYNAVGQLGLGDTTQRLQPTLVTVPWTGTISQVRCGSGYNQTGTLVITSNGEAWYAGSNNNYQAARDSLTTANQTSFVRLPGTANDKKWKDGMILGHVSEQHVRLIDEDNNLYAHGYGNYGACGIANDGGSVFRPTRVPINMF